ncbi:hypothetical protein BaRGS_00015745, partial [Batillaria attramentaria]
NVPKFSRGIPHYINHSLCLLCSLLGQDCAEAPVDCWSGKRTPGNYTATDMLSALYTCK